MPEIQDTHFALKGKVRIINEPQLAHTFTQKNQNLASVKKRKVQELMKVWTRVGNSFSQPTAKITWQPQFQAFYAFKTQYTFLFRLEINYNYITLGVIFFACLI